MWVLLILVCAAELLCTRLTAQPLIEAPSTLSEQDRRTISRDLRLLRAALDPEAQDE
jgi:hypothetical protein